MPPIALPDRPRILVVALRRLGDVLLTTPLIRSLRRAYSGATIDALVFAGTAAMLKGNPDLNKIVVMPDHPRAMQSVRLALELWRQYDLAISTQTGDRPTFFAVAAGRQRAGLVAASGALGTIKRFLLQRPVPALDKVHRVEQALQLADALGVERVPQLVCPAAADAGVPDEPYAVIHAAPKFRYKQWTREGWRALAAGLKERGLAIVAIGGPDPAERRYLDDVWRDIVNVRHTQWPEVVSLLRKASVYVGPDTSVTHLAAAAGCKTVALFGPMDPRVWGPWPVGGPAEPWAASGAIQHRGNVFVVQNPLPCLPCTFEGCERHIGSYSACLDELAPEQVLAAVDRALA